MSWVEGYCDVCDDDVTTEIKEVPLPPDPFMFECPNCKEDVYIEWIGLHLSEHPKYEP